MAKKIKIGDTVTFYCLHQGKLTEHVAKVVKVWAADESPQALGLEVDFPDQYLIDGLAREQTHSRQTKDRESGGWSA